MTSAAPWDAVLSWLYGHEALFIFLAIFLEESGVPMPLPADIAMALAGYRVAQGQMSLFSAFAIGQSATLLGSSVLYWVGRRGGRPLIARYGHLLFLTAERLDRAERLITRLGPLAVIIGRQIPGLRLASPLACGVFRIPYHVFVPAMIVGSTVYIGAFIALGVYGGPSVLHLFEANTIPFRFVVVSLLLVACLALLRALMRRGIHAERPSLDMSAFDAVGTERTSRSRVGDAIIRRVPLTIRRTFDTSLMAGLGASITTALMVTWILELAGFLLPASPEHALLRFLEGTPVANELPLSPVVISSFLTNQAATAGIPWQRFGGLLVTLPLQVVGHLTWAMVYGFVAERRLHGSPIFRGMQFAGVLWLATGTVVYPVIGAGLFGVHLDAGLAPFTAELVRHLVFGASLGVLFHAIRRVLQPGSSPSGTFATVSREIAKMPTMTTPGPSHVSGEPGGG